MAFSFLDLYPHVAEFVECCGWIELGHDDFSESFVRALDEGGMIWEGKPSYKSVDDALQDLETALERWLKENKGD